MIPLSHRPRFGKMPRMARRLWIILCCVFFTVFIHAQMFAPSNWRISSSTGSSAREFASPNGKFVLIFEEADRANPTQWHHLANAIMARRSGDEKSALWSTNLLCPPLQYLASHDVLVSDSGDCFALAAGPNSAPSIASSNRVTELQRNDDFSSARFLSGSDPIMALDTVDGATIFRLWDRGKNQWLAYRPSDGSEIKVTPDLNTRWTEEKRREILDRIAAADQELLRQKIGNLSRAVANIVASAGGPEKPRVGENDYEFLTLQRNPEDRRWLTKLLEMGEEVNGTNAMFLGSWPPSQIADIVGSDLVRSRADWLLAIWDKRTPKDFKPNFSSGDVDSARPRINLGRVMGTVRFALPINLWPLQPNPAATSKTWPPPSVRVMLIPVTPGKGQHPLQTESASFYPHRDQIQKEDVTDEISFAFTTVRPGSYRAKAIWDKRAPFTDGHEAGPGDYESPLSPPFEVVAGQTIPNIVVECKTRVPGGEPYYRADDTLIQKWESGELQRYAFAPDPQGRTDLFWRKAGLWIAATNHAPDLAFAKLASIGTTTFGPVQGSEIPRPSRLLMLFKRSPTRAPHVFDGPSDIRIFDEHGCSYRHTLYTDTPKFLRYVFNRFPRSADSWRVVGYSQPFDPKNPNANVIFEYKLRNLVKQSKLPPTTNSAPGEINLPDVKMIVESITKEYLEPTLEAKFHETGSSEPSKDWHVREAVCMDEEGNVINPLEICREQKTFRVVGRAGRNKPEMITVPFEFSVNR